ncbi:polysaccharide pyruvyl transferase family protein [Microbacterium sp. zg.Y909]|uniref:polysaccharide pyruvyl transferase family protein n=1 Tax=Microbacterium sp. zg.Y909 TaxID=2969413 RepID=UPI00214B1FBC|nr:polysaccharide pyruvyl transferase family protein [Microbacterium sp. zg.Y909]MCR2825898.1 polysaccharide pyruvyl transferase family protein [Microbacterium sp. zg.Y909]
MSGQYDNLGDALLRRAFVHALSADYRWHVYVGDAPADYLAALQLPPDAALYRSFSRWLLIASLRMLRPRRARFLSNPGEISSSRTEFGLGVASAWLLLLGRLVGNPGFRVGLGARDRVLPASVGHEVAARLARRNTWRDEESRRMYGRGEVSPDWAFSLSPRPPDEERRYVALVYRADWPLPSDEVLQSVVSWSRRHGLEPVAVSQALRDHEGTAALAQRLGLRHVGTDTRSLTVLERQVRALYSAAAVVVGNRVHGLIVGAVDGAAPAIVIGHPDVKLARTLRAAGLCAHDGVTVDAPHAVGPYLDLVHAQRTADGAAVLRADAALRRLANAVNGARS